jgi:hypothetical protein
MISPATTPEQMISIVVMIPSMIDPPFLTKVLALGLVLYAILSVETTLFLCNILFLTDILIIMGANPQYGVCPHYFSSHALLFLCQEKFTRHLIPCIRRKGLGNT